MSGLTIRAIIFLVGLGFFLIPLLLISQRDSLGLLFSSWGVGLILIVGSFWMGSWKIYQCAYSIPDRIKLVGHIKDDSNPRPNHYLVILYRENEELARDITRIGKFDVDKKDKQNDGYFELEIANEYQVNRCSMPIDFKQDSVGHNWLSFGKKSTYLWHNFADIEAGASVPMKIEDRKKKYTLVVLPGNMDNYPKEISNTTYLDQNGKVTINIPITTYTGDGNSQSEVVTGYFVHANPSSNSAVLGIRDAWVIDGTVSIITGTSIGDDDIIDIDNCAGSAPINIQKIKSLTYVHEVKFQTNANSNYDLGIVALKAGPSLGFTQGQIDTKEATINIDVPVRAHKKYKIVWQELWKTGLISIDLGQQIIQIPFRAKAEMNWYPQSFDVACP
jgi:hypothetical protein